MSSESKRVLEVVMKTCPVCGLDVEDSYLFCPDDGSKLIEAVPTDQSFTPAADARPKAEAGAPNDVVVMYCGECAAEYPMTFVECPVHHVPLTRDKIRPKVQPIARVPAAQAGAADSNEREQSRGDGRDQGYERPFQEASSLAASQLPESFKTVGAEQQDREASPAPASSLSYASLAGFGTKRELKSGSPSILAFDDPGEEREASEPASAPVSRYDTPSFRIVAATMVMGLAIFCVVAVYTFFSAGGRRQTVARATQLDATAAVIEPPPFVPTPDSARAYEAQQAQEPPPSDGSQANPPAQRQDSPALPPSTARGGKAGADLRNLQPETSPKPTPVSITRTPNATPSPGVSKTPTSRESSLPRIEPGSVDARLIRIRSMRTASGVRYDLTFDLRDESGRHTQWERILISTRSASGISHTQAVPFVHRLGANGALTFTVSVEMRGNSEPDWHGRVVCTTTGEDNDGRPLRASFGTSVTP